MFKAKTLSAAEAKRQLLARSCEIAGDLPTSAGEVAKFGYLDKGLPFFLTLQGDDGTVEGLTFYTQVPGAAHNEPIHAFNSMYRFSKAYVKDDHTCLTMSMLSPHGTFPADYFGKALALWELALPKFGETVLSTI